MIEAQNQIEAALAATTVVFNPEMRTALIRAIDAYIAALPPIVGHALAFRYEAAVRALEQAEERVTRLQAALGGSPRDEADAVLWASLYTQYEAAGNAAQQAWDELQAAITREVERDLGPQGQQQA